MTANNPQDHANALTLLRTALAEAGAELGLTRTGGTTVGHRPSASPVTPEADTWKFYVFIGVIPFFFTKLTSSVFRLRGSK